MSSDSRRPGRSLPIIPRRRLLTGASTGFGAMAGLWAVGAAVLLALWIAFSGAGAFSLDAMIFRRGGGGGDDGE